MELSRPLAIVCLVAGLAIYLGAVSGLLFADNTPATDVGAVSTLVVFMLFSAYAFFLGQKPKPAV